MSTIAQLETRIYDLEQRLEAQQAPSVIPPGQLWMVRAKARPGESWPTSGNVFDGILIEPTYTPGVDDNYTAAVLGDLTDASKGSWIKFWSAADPGEETELVVWRPNGRGDNWYDLHRPRPLVAWVWSGGWTGKSYLRDGETGVLRMTRIASRAGTLFEDLENPADDSYFELPRTGAYSFVASIKCNVVMAAGAVAPRVVIPVPQSSINLRKSTDGGATWDRINQGAGVGLSHMFFPTVLAPPRIISTTRRQQLPTRA
jgi:hypothetical protein